MDLEKPGEDGVLTAAWKREPRHKKPRDKWNLIGRSWQEPYDIANMKPDTTKKRLLGKGTPNDNRPCKRQDVDKRDPKDRTIKRITKKKATDQESDEDDDY